MNILCHRGFWKTNDEKNSAVAFARGFELGLGTETDIRDCNGELVISHDLPCGEELRFSDFLKMLPDQLLLALNVKSDGLLDQARSILERAGHKNYFFFDMSVPDMIQYLRASEPIALRISEYETLAESFCNQVQYVWLDAFESIWYDHKIIDQLLSKDLHVIIVSAELHKRDHSSQWKMLAKYKDVNNLTLCTDLPIEAMDTFQN